MIRAIATFLVVSMAAVLLSTTGRAHADPAARYRQAKIDAAEARARWHERTGGALDAATVPQVEAAVIDSVTSLARHWLGTPWGLGAPQTDTPGAGKINCGTFVGTVLRDAGFVVNVRKLQRQPSQKIIESFVGRARTRKFSNVSMPTFLASVREMGPGLFIIGLDFHVGLLLQTEDDLRFLHASYVTGTVVDEAAASAAPIVDSRYRVVGKILSEANLRDWLRGRRIEVMRRW